MPKKKVGILGGTFNPPHIGHLIMANEVYHAMSLDEVRFMPSQIPPHKKIAGGTTSEQRIRMIELSIADVSYFSLEQIEFERSGPSYTFDTMMLLKQREPDVDFYFIIGGDMIDYLPKWYRIEELIREIKFIGIPRSGAMGESHYSIHMVKSPMVDVSSTLLRERLKQGKNVSFLLPDAVSDFISKEGLYESL
ncbi:nicotinate-nucleotide adenylyltransferase [Jeotgalibacillus soli]|uniref:Probable nicotinate-nucleotide adenylyltransferase n=1 Tax=Jeotgalibacillus soli TaxID=889306 RepID=A0A0C2VJ16_9BACL|nr:nicotinate-nucleotide adenylyltransferase [Jeotgalibacillus soli]KIL44476.1 nicotinate-nucleotide adenylyltransferase [Jeotgalibacillus soli]